MRTLPSKNEGPLLDPGQRFDLNDAKKVALKHRGRRIYTRGELLAAVGHMGDYEHLG